VDEQDFSPLDLITVSACGMTSAGGAVDAPGGALSVAAELRAARSAAEAEKAARERGETKAETKARLERESAELGNQLKRNIADGLKSKTADAANAGNKKAKTSSGGMMASMLGDISDDSSDDDDEE
jgi:hypothetical protein